MAKAKAGRATVKAASLPNEQDWRVRSALSTLKEADQIRADPKLMRQVGALAKQEQQVLGKIARRTGSK